MRWAKFTICDKQTWTQTFMPDQQARRLPRPMNPIVGDHGRDISASGSYLG
jgi:hypothetical protein